MGRKEEMKIEQEKTCLCLRISKEQALLNFYYLDQQEKGIQLSWRDNKKKYQVTIIKEENKVYCKLFNKQHAPSRSFEREECYSNGVKVVYYQLIEKNERKN